MVDHRQPMALLLVRVLAMSVVLGLGFLLLVVVAGSVLLIRAVGSRNASVGADLVAYGLLAIFMGGTVWSLFLLARAAFPDQNLIGRTSQSELAGALAGLIVAAPITYILWRRQDGRRNEFPDSSGWSIYLALTDLVYLTWLVTYLVLIFDAVFSDGTFPRITDVLIVAGVVGLHEWASRVDQPGGNISQVHRVVGSFIGLAALWVGLSWALAWLLDRLYSTFTATAGSTGFAIAIGMTIVGGLIWAVRWLAPWHQSADGTKLTYLVAVVTTSFLTMVGALTGIVVLIAVYLLDRPSSPGAHFSDLSIYVAVAVTSTLVWKHHGPLFGTERTDAIRSHQYLTAAIALSTAIGTGVGLARILFEPDPLVDDIAVLGIAAVIVLAVAAVVWWIFWTNAQQAPRNEEASSLPRKFYVLGMAVILGLITAGAVVGILLYIFRSLFSLDSELATLVTELALAALAGGATFHLISQNKSDSEFRDEKSSRPYLVTVVCSHPGPLAASLPKVATLRIIHRGDEIGVIDDEMAAAIVAQTTGVDSIVWVDESGFKAVPALHA